MSNTNRYQQEYQAALSAPEAFWQQQAAKLSWYKAPHNILQQQDADHYQWFSDGVLNTAYLALDYQIEQGRGEQTALIYDSPVSNTKQRFSYRQLRDEVAQFAGVLKALGVAKGDRVVIYMPMIPQAAIAMLAVARLGAVHSVVFGGFSAHAGQSQLINWAKAIGGQPQFYLVHGEPKAQQALQSRMMDYGLHCQIAEKGQQIKL